MARDATIFANECRVRVVGQLLPAPLAAIVGEYSYCDPAIPVAIYDDTIMWSARITLPNEKERHILFNGGRRGYYVAVWSPGIVDVEISPTAMCEYLFDGRTGRIPDTELMREARWQLYDHIIAESKGRPASGS